MLRIGLDIDDVLGDFMGHYYTYFDCAKHPERLQNDIITKNVQRIRRDKQFWVEMPSLYIPDFEPELYCTKRINPKAWTKEWIENQGLPKKPVYQLYSQSANKARLIKGRVDVFIDDSVYNVRQMNEAGVPTLLFRGRAEGVISVYSLQLDEISKAYKSLLKRWKSK